MEEKMLEQEQTEQSAADAAVLAEIDRRVAEAVAQARAQWQAEEDAAAAERARMEAMSEEERAGYALARRESELDERERRIAERELRALAMEKLAERGLPRELAEAVPYTDRSRCLAGIDAVERAFRRAVQQGVDERLCGDAPSAGHPAPESDALPDEAYYRMQYAK